MIFNIIFFDNSLFFSFVDTIDFSTFSVNLTMGELYLVISIWFDNMHEKAAFHPLLSQLNGNHVRDSNQDDNKNEINIDSQKSYANYQANEISLGNNGIGKDKNEGDKNGGDKNREQGEDRGRGERWGERGGERGEERGEKNSPNEDIKMNKSSNKDSSDKLGSAERGPAEVNISCESYSQ